jgi:predicted enzyme related to lactoylglutathione lyase
LDGREVLDVFSIVLSAQIVNFHCRPAINIFMQTAILYRIILPVKNIELAVAFYGAVLGTPGQQVSPGRHYFRCGSTILACYDPVADGDGGNEEWSFHSSQYLYFAVSDLEATLAKFQKAGGTVDGGIETKAWGERLFCGRDPFGGRISFVDEATVFTARGMSIFS